MAIAATAIRSARIYLNDINGVTWSDAVLMPLLQEAFGEITQELDINGVGTIKTQTGILTVPAFATNLGNQQPANILNPISMLEGNPGDVPDNFQDMLRVTFLPYINQDQWLSFWAWLGDTIQFVGATVARSVILRYEGAPPVPQTLNDPLGIIFAERFIGPRIAALAYASIDRNPDKVQAIAASNLYKLVQSQVVQDQRPTRRKGYRSYKPQLGIGPAGITISTSVPQGLSVVWISTITPPNGVINTFVFPYNPIRLSWNGLNLFQGTGYLVTIVNGLFNVQLIDANRNVITPQAGDDIREASIPVGGSVPIENWVQAASIVGNFANFTVIPKYISWNGLNQFINSTPGFRLIVSQGLYAVSFVDANGATLTPNATDDIRAETA